jgi:hypothetical protein
MTKPVTDPTALGDFPVVPPAQHRRPPHHRGMFWIAVLAALAAVASGVVITATAYINESQPETAAVGYFQALGRGDAPGALRFGALPAGPRTYLTSQVLDAARSIAKISDVRVLSVVRDGGQAKVTLEYQLGSQQVSDTVSLVRHGRGWRLTRAAVPVPLHVVLAADRMSIAGAPVPDATVLLFPGVLPVAPDTPNLELGSGLQVVHLNGGTVPPIRPQVSPVGQQRVSDAVRAVVQACVSGRTSGYCPPPADPTVVPGSVRGRIAANLDTELPISVAPGPAGVLVISGNVAVDGSYRQLDFNNQPVLRTGNVELQINARCNATNPAKLVWVATS